MKKSIIVLLYMVNFRIERDIGEFITKPYLLGNEIYTKTIFISYTLLIEGVRFSLDVLFIKNI